ncbi:hypothetical protein NDU88_002688 [Pleurodeles waltl]|uniref:Uncharacterized protein n=1 Tax=Pleurodeles waltl TaxID=8319 RepID=A0AAV7SBA4_PLEWA|nr:hypothetical protein NDU88_002688 [Pleurodeles waltl]
MYRDDQVGVLQIQANHPIVLQKGISEMENGFHLEVAVNNKLVERLEIDNRSHFLVLLLNQENGAGEARRIWVGESDGLLLEKGLNLRGDKSGHFCREMRKRRSDALYWDGIEFYHVTLNGV